MVKESGREYPKALISWFIAFVLGKAFGSEIRTYTGGVGKPGVPGS